MTVIRTTRACARGRAVLVVVAIATAVGAGCSGDVVPLRVATTGSCIEAVTSRYYRVPQLVHPRMAARADGRAVLTWLQCEGEEARVWATDFDGQQWAAPRRLGVERDLRQQVAFRASDNGVAVWRTNIDGTRQMPRVYYSLFDPLVGWLETRPLDAALDASDLRLSRPGNLLVWQASYPENTALRASRLRADGTWSAAERLATGGLNEFRMAGDAEGDGVVVWQGLGDATEPQLWSARFDRERGWQDRHGFATAGALSPTRALNVDLNDAGTGFAVWQEWRVGVVFARYTESSGWERPVRLPLGDREEGATALAVDAAGRGHLLWTEDGSRAIWAVRLLDGRVAETPRRIGTGDGALVATRADGTAIAAWRRSDSSDGTHVLQVSRYRGGGWSEPEDFASFAGPIDFRENTPSAVVIDERGYGFVVWVEQQGEQRGVWVRRFAL